MRKILPILIPFILLCAILVFILEFNTTEPENSTPSTNEEQTSHQEKNLEPITGYFYFGYIDMRDKLEEDDEEEYFYYMDKYFQAYYRKITMPEENTELQESEEENYEDYFREESGFNLLTIPSEYRNELKNGDYISIIVDGPIYESFPMQGNVTRVEVIKQRNASS
ncbi:DUF3221 domain-containing protein [Gracilibacillus massiliensis]|uniref:DUF3221 domain-containing protein n=1 Tax=Gracilibacillus massiliensis TaxID=1564956 RepID=UPI00071C79AD|nr:DUF3221 domain-containing protein [Gracilibacillus massiliensis]